MLASYLSNKLATGRRNSTCAITLVESSEVPRTGVGEATIHTMRQFLADCGIAEADFLSDCGATLKHGIEFEGWMADGGTYFHPFEVPPALDSTPLAVHFLAARAKGRGLVPFDHWAGIQSRLARKCISPRKKGDPQYQGVLPYGYHLDANAFAHFLKGVATGRGVAHKLSHVDEVAVDGENISSLTLRNGERIEADLWVDCTGFSARLMRSVGARFVGFGDRLPVDSAWTCQAKAPPKRIRPFTTARARSAGWTFDIDLQHRGGRGYIYSRRHISEDAAAREFCEAYPDEIDPGDLKKFDLSVGRLDRCWVGNCVAVGLSAGFLEPLESTGLYFVETAARLIHQTLDSVAGKRDSHPAWFNRIFCSLFDETADFIEMHYRLSDRRDSDFWCDFSQGAASDTLSERLEIWRSQLPSAYDFDRRNFFGAESWTAILLGMRRLPDLQSKLATVDVVRSVALLRKIDGLAGKVGSQQPGHGELLQVQGDRKHA